MRTMKPYEAHGLRVFLVKEEGVKLAERPILRTPSDAAPIIARFIGESDREQFVVARSEPSPEDVALTRRLVSAGTLLGIDVLDHLVLGEAGRFVSLKQRGVL